MTVKLSKKHRVRIARWIAALRSGRYQQTTGQLHSGAGYCCLGVACDVYRKANRRGEWKGAFFTVYGESWLQVLPTCVTKYFFKSDIDQLLTDTVTAVHANDNLGWSFNRIATALEKRYLSSENQVKP